MSIALGYSCRCEASNRHKFTSSRMLRISSRPSPNGFRKMPSQPPYAQSVNGIGGRTFISGSFPVRPPDAFKRSSGVVVMKSAQDTK